MPENVGFLKQVQDAYSAAREARKEAEDLWEKCIRAYRGQYDFSNRLLWQSQHVLPKIAKDVDFVAQMVSDGVGDQQEQLFALTGNGPWGKLAAPILEAIVQAELDQEGFSDTMRGLVTYGLCTPGLAVKLVPKPGPWTGWTGIEPVSYRSVFKDPTGRAKSLIIVTAFDKADVLDLCKANGWDAKAAKNLSDTGDADARRDAEIWLKGAASAQGWPSPTEEALRRTVFLSEYYGPYYDDNGDRKHEWCYGVIANNCVVLHGPEDAPYGYDAGGNVRKWTCAIVGDIMSDPFAIYPKPMISDALGIASAQNDIANLILDQAQLQINAVGINFDAIEAAGAPGARVLKQITGKTGVNPGQPVPFRGAAPPLVPLELARFSPQLLDVQAMLETERQAATGASDMVRGLAATEDTSSETLGEFKDKKATAGNVLVGLAKGIERRFIEPLVEQKLWHYREAGFSLLGEEGQNAAINAVAGSQIEQAIESALGDGLAMSPEEALAMLDAACNDEYQVRAAGVSAVMARSDAQAALGGFLQQVAAIGAQAAVDQARTLRTMARLAGLDLDDVLKDDFEAILDQTAMMQGMAQMMGPAGGGAPGGGPPQGGGAPPEGGPPTDEMPEGMPPEMMGAMQ